MQGWKTLLGGLAIAVPGALEIAIKLIDASAGTPFTFTDVQGALTQIGAGLGAIGIGHKIEKHARDVAAALATAGKVVTVVQDGANTRP